MDTTTLGIHIPNADSSLAGGGLLQQLRIEANDIDALFASHPTGVAGVAGRLTYWTSASAIDDAAIYYNTGKLAFGPTSFTPTASIHLKPAYLSTVTSGEMMLKFTPPNNASDFGFLLTSTLEGADPNDDVVMWGWNVDDHIAPATEPSIHFAMERTFGSGTTANFEVHLEVHPKDGGAFRPWTWAINRKTGAATVTTNAASNFGVGDNNVFFHSDETLFAPAFGALASVPFRIVNDSITFETFTNGGANTKQIRIAPLAADSLQSTIIFGDANGLQLTRYPGFNVLVLNDLNSGGLADMILRRVRLPGGSDGLYVNSIMVVSDQGAAVADPTGGSVIDVECRAQLASLLARVRAHGLIA